MKPEAYNERVDAKRIAERTMHAADRGRHDPDGDLCILARQFVRAEERTAAREKELEEAKRLLRRVDEAVSCAPDSVTACELIRAFLKEPK